MHAMQQAPAQPRVFSYPGVHFTLIYGEGAGGAGARSRLGLA